MPVDREPLDDRVGDDSTHALGLGQLVAGGGADRGHRSELGSQGPRGGGPDVADGKRHQHSPERLSLRLIEVVEEALAVDGEDLAVHRLGRLRLLGSPGEQRHGEELLAGEREEVALVGHHPGVEQRDRALPAQDLDVKGATAGESGDPLAQLGGAGSRVGAADVLVALLLGGEWRTARRAYRRHLELALGAVAELDDRPHDLRDHVARLAQHHGVADEDALASHLVRVVEGRPLDRGTGHDDRRHQPERRHATRAADVDEDVEQLGVDLFRRVLVRDGPPRRS